MKRTIILALAVVLALSMVVVSGCTPAQTPAPALVPAPEATAPAETESETGLKHDFIIGWQPNTLTPPWQERLRAAEMRLEEVNAELGTSGTLMVRTPELHGNIVEQSALFDDLIASGVDIIIGIAADPESYAGLAARAVAAGIPVGVMVETSDIPNVSFRVTQDEEEAGFMLGEKVAADLGGSGNVVLMRGQIEHSVDIGRTTGILNALAQHPGIIVLAEQQAGWATEPAARLMDDWIIAFGDEIDAVVALNDNMALGAIASARAAGRSYLVYGMDGTVEGIRAILAGDLVASMDSDFVIFGRYLIDAAVDYLKHGTTQTEWLIPNSVIDSSNAQAALERYENVMSR